MKQNYMKYKRLAIIYFLQFFIFFSTVVYAGQLVIVIDDIGYRKEDKEIYTLPKEVSIAIIPSSPHATSRAEDGFKQQRDILIHLPMQPLSDVRVEKGALKTGMSRMEVKELIDDAREKVPYAIGLNNHMGSAATVDRVLMEYLMELMAQNKLFFLDSRTNSKTIGATIADNYGIPALKRHIFLDDSNKFIDVKNQFNSAVHYAQKYGLAILIGHPRPNSIKVLKQGIKHLPKDVELVKISHLWRNNKIIPEQPFKLFFDIKPSQTSLENPIYVPLLRGVPKY